MNLHGREEWYFLLVSCVTHQRSHCPLVVKVASKGFNQRDLQYIYHIFYIFSTGLEWCPLTIFVSLRRKCRITEVRLMGGGKEITSIPFHVKISIVKMATIWQSYVYNVWYHTNRPYSMPYKDHISLCHNQISKSTSTLAILLEVWILPPLF